MTKPVICSNPECQTTAGCQCNRVRVFPMPFAKAAPRISEPVRDAISAGLVSWGNTKLPEDDFASTSLAESVVTALRAAGWKIVPVLGDE